MNRNKRNKRDDKSNKAQTGMTASDLLKRFSPKSKSPFKRRGEEPEATPVTDSFDDLTDDGQDSYVRLSGGEEASRTEYEDDELNEDFTQLLINNMNKTPESIPYTVENETAGAAADSPDAEVDEDTEIGEDIEVGEFAEIGEDTEIVEAEAMPEIEPEAQTLPEVEAADADTEPTLSIDELLRKYLDPDTLADIYADVNSDTDVISEEKSDTDAPLAEAVETESHAPDYADDGEPEIFEEYTDENDELNVSTADKYYAYDAETSDTEDVPDETVVTDITESIDPAEAINTAEATDIADEPDNAEADYDENVPADEVKTADAAPEGEFEEYTWDFGEDYPPDTFEAPEISETDITAAVTAEDEENATVAMDTASTETDTVSEDTTSADAASTEIYDAAEPENADDDTAEPETAYEDDVAETPYAEEENPAADDAQEVDDTDITLMVGLGMMDDERKKAVGAKKVEDVEKNIERAHSKREQAPAFEYTDRTQIKKIGDEYKYQKKSTFVKLIIAAVFAAALLVFENITLIGKQFSGAIDPAVYPVVYVMVDLQLFLLCCAAAYDQILGGIASLFKGKPTPESLTATVAVVSVISTVITAATAKIPYEPALFNFPAALGILMTLIFSYYNIKREIFSFNIVSSKRPKYVLRRLEEDEAELENGIFSAEGMTSDKPEVLRIEKASFVDGYFRRTNAPSESKRVVTILIPVLLAVYAIFFALPYFVSSADIAAASSTAFIAALFCYPLSLYFTYSVPFYKANKNAFENDGTIIGDSSLSEYSKAAVISFDDKNVFPSYNVKVKNLNIYDNNLIEKVFYCAASLFIVTGGPLADVFDVATRDLDRSDDVALTENSVGYLSAVIDGDTDVVFAKHDALKARGYNLPAEIWDDSEYAEEDVSVMYMLINGAFAAKLYIKYVMDPDFEQILKQLRQNGMCVGVKTFDPNIDAEMIGRKIKMKKYPLRVLKTPIGESASAVPERSDSGIVTRTNTKSLLHAVTLCDKVINVRKYNLVIKLISVVVALVIVGLISASGTVYDVRSLYIAIYQLFWILPMLLTTRIFI